MAKGNEVSRARHLAVEELARLQADQQRSGVTIRAIEIRLTGSKPDIALHVGSGSQSQGGYLFFVEDLLIEAAKPRMVV